MIGNFHSHEPSVPDYERAVSDGVSAQACHLPFHISRISCMQLRREVSGSCTYGLRAASKLDTSCGRSRIERNVRRYVPTIDHTFYASGEATLRPLLHGFHKGDLV